MQLYGWYHWLHGGMENSKLTVSSMSILQLALWTIAGVAITALWGLFMARYTDASLPYADAFTTVISLIAQWLLARKKLESWYFWIAVDFVAIGVYLKKDLFMTTGLYAVFLVMASMGYLAWRHSFYFPAIPVEIETA